MKKIMFSTEYGLQHGVIARTKTMTRRVERIDFFPGSREEQIEKFSKRSATDAKGRQVWLGFDNKGNWIAQLISRYAIGEEIAIAQPYKVTAQQNREWLDLQLAANGQYIEELMDSGGWTNKMFVSAYYCPNRIRITDIKAERLQDISDEDIYKEGFDKACRNNGWGNAAYHWETLLVYYDGFGRTKEIRSCHPKDAFADLIDKVSGSGTWERNPWVFVYEFELVKQQRVRIELKQTEYGTDNKE